ncbi:Trp biosynthesis-associated membrane protein [Microbacterium luticocti]|uniref:Trp biosynthesis-associated membrane protein n=1 Tax=Microbacterium luticocti TaxID=451764 RepID=UPI0003FA4EF6|nr:Trp biosynthesis-associated membrane protein [Microbacterium luticocti]
MKARARLTSVVLTVLCGALGLMSSTQTWLHVRLTGAAAHDLTVTGAAAIPVLAPLSLAVLALGAALSIVGRALRYLFGAIALGIGVVQLVLSARVGFGHPISAVARTVTDATGIAGDDAVSGLVDTITGTAWPLVAVAVWAVLCAVAVFVLATAAHWGSSGRKYRTDAAPSAAAGPVDAIDSWDDLSRGEDPTADRDPR